MSVNAIRKQSTDEEVTSLAKSLIKSWKKLLDIPNVATDICTTEKGRHVERSDSAVECSWYSTSASGITFDASPLERCGASVDSLVTNRQTCPLNSLGILKIPFLFAQPGVECSQRIFPGHHASTHLPIPSMEQWRGAGPHQCLRGGSCPVPAALQPRNYDVFGQISRDMMERGHDRDALPCRVKVKELRNAYRKAREANSHSDAAPVTCRFYKELDAILGGDPTCTQYHRGHFRAQFNKAGGGAKREQGC
ncbi:Transcription elongation factor A protein 1 [Chelonia mydas]|uniref:Transcription elongation factor A protein 1 n=1 Tax=Chelonia mydas TaxID=8469 RepID=M7BI98_CHEMY|nr:Transcription elongation factor A protein 1 [Chelonia mydas]